MWNDVETQTDYLHFSVISQTVADMIIESGNNPISIGVSGSWGAGKSSMVKMIGESIKERDKEEKKKYIFLEFNAWLYQGYDDARTALLHSVSEKLASEMEERKVKKGDSAWKKMGNFTKRINWFQVSKLALPLLAGFIPGVNAVGAIGGLITAISGSIADTNKVDENSEAVNSAFETLAPEIKDLLKEEVAKPITEQIEEMRKEFTELLEKLDVKLIVLVDDLDRCLPETAVSTLEAMRLLLFVDRTAFIIAADEQMIRNGVKAHFGDVELTEGLVTSYFDKLIQVPISVPHLGVVEIKAYIVLLYLESEIKKGNLNEDIMPKALEGMNKLLSRAWENDITKESIEGVFGDKLNSDISEAISMADQLAGILVVADSIKGNPRLIKRFLNALEIRKKVAKFNGITVDSSQLIKMLLFERCASNGAFDYLSQEVTKAEDGKPEFLAQIEKDLATGNEYKSPNTSWESDFIKNWVLLSPTLGEVDLRPLLYLSRDKALSFASYDELSSEGKKLLEALKAVKTGPLTKALVDGIKKNGENEATILMNHLARIGRTNQWGADTVNAALHITEAFPALGSRCAVALGEIPVKSIKTAIIPLIKEKEWAKDLLKEWNDNTETPKPVKNAIAGTKK
ncbi:MAG: P-loop NTPase fold protein [Lachnospiraceae bacterium]|nr:P-loop NTPase fold protein [Lachnospiraceae bacterium]